MSPVRPRTPTRSRSPARGNGAAPPSDLIRVLDCIRAVGRTLRLSGRSAELSLGVNGAQLFVLQKLAEEPAESLADLAARTHTDPSSVSVVVSRLVRRGLVSREASAEDGRRVTIALTPAGRAVVRRAPRAADAQLVDAAGSLSARQLRSLADGLELLAERIATSTNGNGRQPSPSGAATGRRTGAGGERSRTTRR